MSELKLISPMLDNFAVGGAISEHHGVRCYPAMREDDGSKYIVKVISIPASQNQLDALLLSGAFADEASATNYFKELSDGVMEEVSVLERLSRLEGFLPYDQVQCLEQEDGRGYDIYLLSTYKRTLERQFQKQPLTHLGAINLGLDLCSALMVCRRSGYLYADLQPKNVYLVNDQTFRIGDLGFLKLGSLKYTSLPDKYRSVYTAPEIADAFSDLNTTIDVYAVGLILYQAYNGGALPFSGESTPGEAFPAPAYADQEMAEIILKACSLDPAERWEDPMQMGQALISYMQKNGANDTPIIPPVEEPPVVAEDEAASEEVPAEEIGSEPLENASDAPADDNMATEETEVVAKSTTEVKSTAEVDEAQSEERSEDIITADTEVPVESVPAEAEPILEKAHDAQASQSKEETCEADEQVYNEDDFGNLSFMLEGENDVASLETEDISYDQVSEEVSEILLQVDEIASHPVPDPVVAPEAIDVPIPEPIVVEPESEAVDSDSEETTDEANSDSEEESFVDDDGQSEEDSEPPVDKKKSHWLRNTIIILAVLALLSAAVFYYMNYYLAPVDAIVLDGSKDSLTVRITTDIDESLLTVICSDPHGNQIISRVENGTATFENLVPDTVYSVNIQIEGFHKLTGTYSSAYSTPIETSIVQFTAVTGNEDGSVILNFTITGPDSENWKIAYSSQGEAEKSVSFPSHTTTITGLTIGNEYVFRLIPETELYLTGTNEVRFVASKLIYAEDLIVTEYKDGKLTVQWKTPVDATVGNWSVRCYDADGYNETIITPQNVAQFENLDASTEYTIVVTAAGMSDGRRISVNKNSLSVSNFSLNASGSKATITWDSDKPVGESGWIVSYTIDGVAIGDARSCAENSLYIDNYVPGATYEITVKQPDGVLAVGGRYSFVSEEAPIFSGDFDDYLVDASDLSFAMCRTPDVANWDRYDLEDVDYTTSFAVNQKASFLVHTDSFNGYSPLPMDVMFVVYDADGTLVCASTTSRPWDDMWSRHYCELDIPVMPTTSGSYTMNIYFGGQLAGTQAFNII